MYCRNPLGLFWPFLWACVLHELGHVVLILWMGKRIESIRLGLLGAVIQTGPMSYRQEIICALAGPTVNLVCAMGFREQFPEFAIMSLFLGGFNLLPVYPLDGGRALQACFFQCFSEKKALCLQKGVQTGVLAGIVLFAIWASCVQHYGLWPALIGAGVLFRLDANMRDEK